MRTIVLTYPGFASLPRGLKQMLVASENFYFDEARPAVARPGAARSPAESYWGYGALASAAGFKPLSAHGVAAGRG